MAVVMTRYMTNAMAAETLDFSDITLGIPWKEMENPFRLHSSKAKSYMYLLQISPCCPADEP